VRRIATALTALFALTSLVRSQDAPAARQAVVVIDAGHGGDDIGVRASGLEEKQLTLDIAQALRTRLDRALGLRVIMTRDEDRLLAPDERAAAANAGGGRLFLSLHANAAPVAAVGGAEIYYLAADPASADVPSPADTFLIPWEQAQARHADLSARAAGIVHEELQQAVPMSPYPARPGALRPLVGVNMPAVLVEMLYLTNPEQAQSVADLKERLVTALAAAVDRFVTSAPLTPQ
jgi:N-acetylmuramoyl-L-alanine amidase